MFTPETIGGLVGRLLFMPKSVGGFTWRLLLFYVLLAVVPWPGFRDAYATGFHVAGNAVFGSFGSEGVVRFHVPTAGASDQDTMVTLKNRRYSATKSIACSGWLMAYLPLAAFLALILPTPIPWARRWKALLWGVLGVHVFALLRVLLLIIFGFSGPGGGYLFHPTPFWMNVLGVTVDIVAVNIVSSFVVPTLIWILVTFRRGDWEMILDRTGWGPATRAT